MKCIKLTLLILLTCVYAQSQSSGGLEGYYFPTGGGSFTWVPKAYFDKDQWHVESRYDYEEQGVFSLIAGRTFSKENKLTYSLTPMFGYAAGCYEGAIAAAKIDLDYGSLELSTESQLCISLQARSKNLCYSWNDLGYTISKYIESGLSLVMDGASSSIKTEPGIFFNFSFGEWSIPVYFFYPYNNQRILICGICFTVGHMNQKLGSHSAIPKMPTPKNYFYE